MTEARSAIAGFVRDLRIITARTGDPRVIVAHVSPLVRDLALSKTWLEATHYECDLDQGFGAHLLHEEPDHMLAVFAGAWLPGRGAPPHNHGTWAVVAGVDSTTTARAIWSARRAELQFPKPTRSALLPLEKKAGGQYSGE